MTLKTVSIVEVDEDANVGFHDPKSGCFITDPTRSSCGRFEVDPQLTYGVDEDVVAMLADIGHPDDNDRDDGADLRFQLEQ